MTRAIFKHAWNVYRSDFGFIAAVIEWQGVENMGNTPVFQIHGGKDLVLPVKNTNPDTVVPVGRFYLNGF